MFRFFGREISWKDWYGIKYSNGDNILVSLLFDFYDSTLESIHCYNNCLKCSQMNLTKKMNVTVCYIYWKKKLLNELAGRNQISVLPGIQFYQDNFPLISIFSSFILW